MILLLGVMAFLHLNVSKTKDMIIDFRSKPPAPQITTINGQAEESGGIIQVPGQCDSKLSFNPNTEMI